MLTGVVAIAAAAWLLGSTRLVSWIVPVLRRVERSADQAAAAALGRFSGPSSRTDPVALCGALAAELRAGAPPDAALIAVAADSALLPRARAAAQLGEPVAPALLADAAAVRGSPVAAGVLRGMAACWSVAAQSGAGLADGMDRVAALAGARQRIGADLDAEVAAPRATARILSLLPLLGLALGELLGAGPISWLLTSPVGWLCGALGAGLLLVGRVWSARIAASVLPVRDAER